MYTYYIYNELTLELVRIEYRNSIEYTHPLPNNIKALCVEIADNAILNKIIVPKNHVTKPAFNIKLQRNLRLKDSDWTQTIDAPLTTEKKQEWAIYRQALRDLDFTKDPIEWPTEPTK